MSIIVNEFLDRLFNNNRTLWWKGLSGETRQGRKGKFLQETLNQELRDIPDYRGPGRRLFFFTDHHASSIDGIYKHIGVEEKYNTMDITEDLIDGAIHRGFLWTIGNPQGLSVNKPESISLYVVKKSVPLSAHNTDLFFPIVLEMWKIGIHIVFVDEESGEYWKVDTDYQNKSLPSWLSVIKKPQLWDKKINVCSDSNKVALKVLEDMNNYKIKKMQSLFIESNNQRNQFIEIEIGPGHKVAIMEYGNEWRLIELGLLLRSKGYDAAKVIYNSNKHKNVSRHGKMLKPAGRMVEKRIKDYIKDRFSVIVDWGVQFEPTDHSSETKNVKKRIIHTNESILEDKESSKGDKMKYQDILKKIVWQDQTHVIDSCVKYELPPEEIASILVERRYYQDIESAKKRVKRHLATDKKSKRMDRKILSQEEFHRYLRKFNIPIPKEPYS